MYSETNLQGWSPKSPNQILDSMMQTTSGRHKKGKLFTAYDYRYWPGGHFSDFYNKTKQNKLIFSIFLIIQNSLQVF